MTVRVRYSAADMGIGCENDHRNRLAGFDFGGRQLDESRQAGARQIPSNSCPGMSSGPERAG
jgi:hypothetical protein